ncbi:unnamed protein product [Didymodactylos carnosus]|uniref:Uncharacterized protein n=1 Tax=Didymodactylos carnosus TaxID=1234261 RepID=A0A815B6A1_9BILA|nr:unnamed protein product [Didymodactylos carnosus]CAF1269359.1 unnamed protein product [Didymodactylos carnosus]CAF3983326.1 unnamed protein product [Didymodactylos carnosus]CAF4055967.1 unnamed protein product [Didymodactylos carnosus]
MLIKDWLYFILISVSSCYGLNNTNTTGLLSLNTTTQLPTTVTTIRTTTSLTIPLESTRTTGLVTTNSSTIATSPLPSVSVSTTRSPLSKHTGRRVFFILVGCVITVSLIISMFYTYTVVLNRRGGGDHTRVFSCFRRKFRLFHISPNRGENESRLHLPENQDEALLYDDPYNNVPYADHNSNPYKSLTLAVT